VTRFEIDQGSAVRDGTGGFAASASVAPTALGYDRASDISEMILFDPRVCVRMSIDILRLAPQMGPCLDPVFLAACQNCAKI